ncbi:MAG: DUF1254 domain-containing protein [Rhodoferax sp.]
MNAALLRHWLRRGAPLLTTLLLVHLAAVWAAPYVVMQVLMHGPSARSMQMHNQAAFPPPVTAQSRSVVMPSPDLLYSVCVYDVSDGPLRVQARPNWPDYWSIALYAANSDNFFVLNDRQAGLNAVDLWLVAQGANTATAPPGAQVVVVPSHQGFLLMRVLTADYAAQRAAVEAARRTLVCAKAS